MQKKLLVILLILSLLFIIYSCGTIQQGTTSTTTTSTTSTNSSTTTVTSPTTTTTLNPLVSWQLALEPIYYSSPAIGDDGTIYVGTAHWGMYSGSASTEYGLYAINPTGTIKWKYTTGLLRPVRGSPALGPEGNIYFVVEISTSEIPPPPSYEKLYAVSNTGQLLWDYQITNSTIPQIGCLTPAIAADGTIYVNGSGTFAFNPDGTVKWSIPGSVVHSSPVIAADGTIISAYKEIGDSETGIRAINPNGTIKWSYPPFAGYFVSSPALGSNETIYIGATEKTVGNRVMMAISSTGSLEWQYTAVTNEGDIRCNAAIDSDGTIYFGTTHASQNHIYALNPDGTLKWKYNTFQDVGGIYGHDLYASPAIGADGLIYFVNEYGFIYALNRDGTVNWKDSSVSRNQMAYVWSSPSIGANGDMFVGSIHGTSSFYAIKTGSPGILTAAPSPKFQANKKNNGRKDGII